MATITRVVTWDFAVDPDTATALITSAAETAGFTIASACQGTVEIDVPRALLANQWAAKIMAEVNPSSFGSTVRLTVSGLGNKHYAHLTSIAVQLPERVLDDHGIGAATAGLANKIFGRKEIAHLSNVLDSGERVSAIGVGRFEGKAAIAAVTDRRVVILEKSIGSESMRTFAVNAIQAIDLSKGMTGEKVKLAHSGTTATIDTLSHGQGDALARAIREAQSKAAEPTPTPVPAGGDVVDKLERLAALRASGALTEAEFEAQKAAILG